MRHWRRVCECDAPRTGRMLARGRMAENESRNASHHQPQPTTGSQPVIRLQATIQYEVDGTRPEDSNGRKSWTIYEPPPWASDKQGRPSLGASPISTSLQGHTRHEGPFVHFHSLVLNWTFSAAFSLEARSAVWRRRCRPGCMTRASSSAC
ncbi:hypothetical protein V8C44DRAFT_333457 [Trichoderma aethiopicum]